MSAVEVYICDDDEAVADAMQLLLSTVGVNAQTFLSAESLIETLTDAEAKPRCVIADVRMPGMGGMALQQWLAEAFPAIAVIIVTGHADVPMAVDSMKAGASDFLAKPFRDQALIEAVNRCLAEDQPANTQACAVAETDWQQGVAQLTPREHDVLALLCTAKPNKQIAAELKISPRTLDIHRARVFEKMQVRSSSELLLKMPRK